MWSYGAIRTRETGWPDRSLGSGRTSIALWAVGSLLVGVCIALIVGAY